ncbi:MAG TPA: hypothetical protein VGC22_02530 [Chitinophaga sp.]
MNPTFIPMCKRFLAATLCLFLISFQAFSQDKAGRELFSPSIGFTGFGVSTSPSSRRLLPFLPAPIYLPVSVSALTTCT